MRVCRVLALSVFGVAACGSSTSGTPPAYAPVTIDGPTLPSDGAGVDGVLTPDGPAIDAPAIDARIGPDAFNNGVCGGFLGSTCEDSTTYCVWRDYSCGRADQTGLCTPVPQTCPANYEPVCGCDGQVYGNACAAALMGVDLSDSEGCTAPANYFPCGTDFCRTSDEYCQKTFGGAADSPPTFTCKPIPQACGSSPTCACFAGEQCIMQCTMDHGNTTLTCLYP